MPRNAPIRIPENDHPDGSMCAQLSAGRKGAESRRTGRRGQGAMMKDMMKDWQRQLMRNNAAIRRSEQAKRSLFYRKQDFAFSEAGARQPTGVFR